MEGDSPKDQQDKTETREEISSLTNGDEQTRGGIESPAGAENDTYRESLQSLSSLGANAPSIRSAATQQSPYTSSVNSPTDQQEKREIRGDTCEPEEYDGLAEDHGLVESDAHDDYDAPDYRGEVVDEYAEGPGSVDEGLGDTGSAADGYNQTSDIPIDGGNGTFPGIESPAGDEIDTEEGVHSATGGEDRTPYDIANTAGFSTRRSIHHLESPWTETPGTDPASSTPRDILNSRMVPSKSQTKSIWTRCVIDTTVDGEDDLMATVMTAATNQSSSLCNSNKQCRDLSSGNQLCDGINR